MINASDYITKNRGIDLKNLKKKFSSKKKLNLFESPFILKNIKRQ